MDLDPRLHEELVNKIVSEFKALGIFDQFRKECIADVDTKPAFQNLKSRVEGEVKFFLDKQTWKPGMNKNQLREHLRKYINDASYLKLGLEKIVDQVVNPNIYTVFMPRVRDVVNEYLSNKRPKEDYVLKDLLPENLEPISPNSEKGASLEAFPDKSNEDKTNETTNDKVEKKSLENHKENHKENPEPASKDVKKSSSHRRSRRVSSESSRSSNKRSDASKGENSKNEGDLKSERSSDRSSDRSSEKRSRDKKKSRSSDHRRRSPGGKKSSDADKPRSRSRKRHLSGSKSSDESSSKKQKVENSENLKDTEKEAMERDVATIPDEERVQIVSGDESCGSSPKSDASMTLQDSKKVIFNNSLPDEERVQIVSDEDSRDSNANPTMTLEETTKIIFG